MTEPQQLDLIGRHIDRLVTVEARISPTSRNVIVHLYEAACAAQGAAQEVARAEVLVARLEDVAQHLLAGGLRVRVATELGGRRLDGAQLHQQLARFVGAARNTEALRVAHVVVGLHVVLGQHHPAHAPQVVACMAGAGLAGRAGPHRGTMKVLPSDTRSACVALRLATWNRIGRV